MRVAAGIEMLEISAVIMGKPNVIHPTLLWDEQTAILVDAGFPGQTALLREAVAKAGVPWERLDTVILTHCDIDHLGGVAGLLKEAPGPVAVLAGAAETPYVQGERRSPKLTPEVVARAVASLPVEWPEQQRNAFRAALEHPPTAHVDRMLAGGEELPECGGIVVIETPGHSPGHICLYHRPSKTLIAGDALRLEDGELQGPEPRATPDLPQALGSLKNLAPFDIASVICYHGGLYRGDINRRIAELV